MIELQTIVEDAIIRTQQEMLIYLTTEPYIKPYVKKEKKVFTSRLCKVCNIEKRLEDFVSYVSNNVGPERIIKMKKICLECQKDLSHKYYEKNKKVVLKAIKAQKEKKAKKYNVQFKFNNMTELDNQIKMLKYKFDNNLIDEIKQRKQHTRKPEVSEAKEFIITI